MTRTRTRLTPRTRLTLRTPRTPRTRVGAATVTAATVTTAALTAAALALTVTGAARATVEPGTPAKDVHVGLDNDNAANPFIQPAGVAAPQHMDDSDLMFGRDGDDLLIGRKGSDTLLGGPGSDILIGGPDVATEPRSDVLVGDVGDDVGLWAPGDGNDVFAADEGSDTMILGPLVTAANGRPVLRHTLGRDVPRADLGGPSSFGCTLVPVPPSEPIGVQYLVRFTVGSTLVATVRLKDVEQVVCPGPTAGTARVADLTAVYPTFVTRRLDSLRGVVGAIVAPQGG